MSATIIPFPRPARRSPEIADEGFIANFLRELDENRSLNREFKLTGREWLEVIDLTQMGFSKRDAARIVLAKR